MKCGGGATLYLMDDHYFLFSAGLGACANNFAELFTLKLLLIFALEKGCTVLQVFGDSMIILNWIKELQRCQFMRLVPILADALDIKHRFDSITFTHVYRKRNGLADRLSKESTQLPLGTWQIEEHIQNQVYRYFHRPFHEGLVLAPQLF